MEFPIEVKSIKQGDFAPALAPKPVLSMAQCGDWVSVRPVGDEYDGRTYLGVYLGDLTRGVTASFNKKTGELILGYGWHNPAMFVPDLNKVIMGVESWWTCLQTPDDLKQITDVDIQNVWYVQALNALSDLEAQEG